ncbi:MAG: holo-ACP synthase [Dehalococcoidia bacterium]|nr:holo-ACP synthase [Dehalococcoidia bacterium]
MQYIGVDIIEIDRISEVIERWGDRFLRRVFTPTELGLYRRRNASLAARFAAKEAVLKSLGACDRGISWQDIEVLAETNGKPTVNLTGKAQKAAQELAIKALSVSLSHSQDYAVAFVVGTAD